VRPITTLRTTCFILLLFSSGVLHAGDTPEAVYQKFHDAMLKGDMDAMLQLSPAAIKEEMATYPPEQSQEMLTMMGKLLPKTFSVVGLEPGADPDTATLYARGMGVSLMDEKPKMQYGMISMVKEGGKWTVSEQSWNNKPPKGMPKSSGSAPAPAAASAAPPAPAAPEPAPAAVAPATSPAPPPVAAAPVAAVQTAPPPTPAVPPKAPEKKKPACIIKQVMSNAEIDACR
jgi:hypothetical protein